MNIGAAFKIARRELRGGIKGFRVFLICLALGVAAIAAIGAVRQSIDDGMQSEGARLLGGDAEIQLTYRTASKEERAWMAATSQAVSEIIDFRSMVVADVAGQEERSLTQVKAVDESYPLYGDVLLEPQLTLYKALNPLGGLPGAVMDKVLADRLGLVPGATLKLGDQLFRLSAIIKREPDSVTAGFNLGPRTIVLKSDLATSGLLNPGTLFESAYRLRLDENADLDALEIAAGTAMAGSGLRWRDRRNASPGMTEFVGRLGTFLILVGLAGMVVGGVGVGSAVRAYIEEKVMVIATLKSLGATSGTVFMAYGLQIAVLSVLGIALGLVLGSIAPLAFAPILDARLPVPLDFGVKPEPIFEALVYGILGAALFAIWPLAQTQKIRTGRLFRDATLGLHEYPGPWFVVLTGVICIFFFAAIVFFTSETWLTVWATIGLFLAFVALSVAARLIQILARWLATRRTVRAVSTLRLAFGAVGGPGGQAQTTVLALGLGLSVLAAIGQIDANLRGAISRDLPDLAPTYFVLDIQTAQLDGVLTRLKNDPGVNRYETAPMLRGVITQINGKVATDIAGAHWVVAGDRGITYSTALPSGSEITAGQWWPSDYSGEPQISFSATEAEEIGLKLGDTMTINVLGRDIIGTITSFRDVDFSNAGMGFVLSMNPAALAGAPHSHIATVYSEPDAEAQLLRDLASTYPNITAIRVRDAIDRVSDVLRSIAAAIAAGASATLLTGVVVLIGTAAAGERARGYEAAILKTLGASRGAILLNFSVRSMLLGTAAGLVAVFVGGAAGWAVTKFAFESDYTFEPISAVAIVFGGIILTTLSGVWFSFRSLSAKPAGVLRAME